MITVNKVYNAGVVACSELIMNVYKIMKELKTGQILEVVSYDLGAQEDIPAWCNMQGHKLLDIKEEGLLVTHFYIQKG